MRVKRKKQISSLAELRAEVHRYNFGRLTQRQRDAAMKRISTSAEKLGVVLSWKYIGRPLLVVEEEATYQ